MIALTKALESALALRRAHDAPASRWHAQAALALADAWAARGRPDIARGLRAEAEELAVALRAANPWAATIISSGVAGARSGDWHTLRPGARGAPKSDPPQHDQ